VLDAAIRACSTDATQSFMLYTQIYSDQRRPQLQTILLDVRKLDIITPSIENVTETALRKGRKPPIPWKQPTILYSPEGKDCAVALARWISEDAGLTRTRAIPLQASLHGAPNVLELWVPDTSVEKPFGGARTEGGSF
jgi:hypothetical protein